jgi:hypothetical protein
MWRWFRRLGGWWQVVGWLVLLPVVLSAWVWSRASWPGWLRVCLILVIASVSVSVAFGQDRTKQDGSSVATSASPSGGSTSTTPATGRRRRHRHRTRPKQRQGHRSHRRHQHDHVGQPVGVPRQDVPRPALTPGVALHVGAGRVCRSGYASSVRDVPSSESDAVYAPLWRRARALPA